MTKHTAGLTLLAALAVVLGLTAAPASAAPSAGPDPSVANFQGKTLDLKQGWGDARACTTDGVTTQCFRSEAEMDRFLATGELDDPPVLSEAEATEQSNEFNAIQAACSSSVRLYDGTSYEGSVLNLSTRGSWMNLSTWGFSDRASSYKIGACSAYFADYTGGGGDWYPGSTGAYAQAASMASGWSNRVSSIYIN